MRVRSEYLNKHPNCEAKRPSICCFDATEIHHKKGRIGDNLTDSNYFLAVCRNCHNWIEDNPKMAKEFGFSLDRLSI